VYAEESYLLDSILVYVKIQTMVKVNRQMNIETNLGAQICVSFGCNFYSAAILEGFSGK